MSEEAILENKLIVFRLENEEYALSVQNVGSIERLLPITRVPSTPPFIKGVINLRGVVTPVIDLKRRFHQIDTEFTNQTRIIIINIEDITVGIIVDSANNVVDIDESQIEPPPEVVGMVEVDYITGVVKLDNRLLILLDLEKILSKEELSELKSMEG